MRGTALGYAATVCCYAVFCTELGYAATRRDPMVPYDHGYDPRRGRVDPYVGGGRALLYSATTVVQRTTTVWYYCVVERYAATVCCYDMVVLCCYGKQQRGWR
eukprot:768725-Rhodomonas_salina.1